MSYPVTTPVFEGPFDLLLHLITRQEVDIYEVSLSEIIDAYLAELDRMRDAGVLDLDLSTEFLLIAATLIDLKARRLLPGRDDLELDEELLYEERDLLLARLLECKTFKDAAAALERRRRAAGRSVPRTAGPEEPFASMAPDPLERTGLDRFLDAARRAFTPRPAAEVRLDHVTPIRVTVREAIDEVLASLPRRGAVTFRRLTADAADRIEVVVRFLAVLELYKRGVIELQQAGAFGELLVEMCDPEAAEGLDLTGIDEWEEGAIDLEVPEDEDEDGADADAGLAPADPRRDALAIADVEAGLVVEVSLPSAPSPTVSGGTPTHER